MNTNTKENTKDKKKDYWAERRAYHERRLRQARMRLWFDTCINAAVAFGAIVAIVLLVRGVVRREVDERAAWNEGRWGVSREVAVAMAERGEGKTAREVLSTDYTNFHGLEAR